MKAQEKVNPSLLLDALPQQSVKQGQEAPPSPTSGSTSKESDDVQAITAQANELEEIKLKTMFRM